ncbi:MAG: hypothetical protein JSS02_31345 [Planctomycetes bacterium]|nr:hypothetical protein [Planctomycetota bacterium]
MNNPICIARDLFEIVRDEHLAPFLKSLGFEYVRKNIFVRSDGDTIWQVATDFVRDTPRDQGRIDINLGIANQSLGQFLKSCPVMATVIKAYRSKPIVMAAMLSLLRPREYREIWIYGNSDPAVVAKMILEDLEFVGIDWFERHGTIEKIMVTWQAKRSRHLWDSFYLAAALWLRGDEKQAMKIVEDARDYYGPFEKKRAIFPDVDEAAQFYDWLIQQPRIRKG